MKSRRLRNGWFRNYAWAAITWACASWITAVQSAESTPGRLRYIIETDAGGDPDDEQSLVRFLLYANEWDVEGIIANRAQARAGENQNPERTGLGIVQNLVRAYGLCYSHLTQHDPRYPSPEQLLARTVPGYDNTEAGVDLIIAAVDRDDPRPVWFSNWGTDHGSARSCLRRALERVLRERGQVGYERFKSRLRLSSADAFGEHTSTMQPPWALWVDTFNPEWNRQRWYHRFSALVAKAGDFDLERDVRAGHGPLGALYPTNTTHPQKEGDTMSFLCLVPNGLNKPEEPGWGGWAGRYGLSTQYLDRPYYCANQADSWQGSTNRDNTLRRWAVDLQNDFKARLEWCVEPFNQANHAPQVIVNGVEGQEPIRGYATAGTDLQFDASASGDPDRDHLAFNWFVYAEAGTYLGPLPLGSSNSPRITVRVPSDAAGKSIHLIVAVTDSGTPALTRYRRVVLHVKNPARYEEAVAPFFKPPEEYAGQFGEYRSPLRFADNQLVKTSTEWPRRRQEILQTWQDFMGPWPPLLRRPVMEILSESRRDSFRQQRVRLEIAPNQTGEGWLLLPDQGGPMPAVLVVYYEPETSIGISGAPLRDFGAELARRGFVTLSIGTPGGNAWKPELGEARCQPLFFHAYVAANCWQALANLPQVDTKRIGVVGHSYGGKWALFAGAFWEKFAAVAVSDPGVVFDETRPNVNYWEPWYLGLDPNQPRPKPGLPTIDNPATGAYPRLRANGHDLHELHALIAPRPLLVSGGSEDPPSRWEALNHKLTLDRLLGFTNRVALTHRAEHQPTADSNEQIYLFFESFLNKP